MGVVTCAYNSSCSIAGSRKIMSSRPAWDVQQVSVLKKRVGEEGRKEGRKEERERKPTKA
jgi:hypothetical protein